MNAHGKTMRANLGWLGAGVAASAVMQYALYFAAARCLGAHDYGVFSLALAAAVLAAPFCDLGSSVAIVCTGARNPAALPHCLGASLLLRALAVVPVAGIALAFGGIAGYGAEFASLFVPLFLAAVADGIGSLGAATCQAREQMSRSALQQVWRNLLRGLALAATAAAGAGPHALAWSFAIASGLGAGHALHVARAGGELPMRWCDLGPNLRAALPFGLAVLGTVVHGQIAVAVLGVVADPAEVGGFHLALRFVLLLQMVPQVVAMASAPLSYRRGESGVQPSAALYRLKITALGGLGLLASLLLANGAVPLVALCLGPAFAATAPLLAALAPLVFVKFTASALGDTLAALSRQRQLGVGCWLAAAVNIATCGCLVPPFGAMGAVAAMLVSETFLLLFLAWRLGVLGLDLAFTRVLRLPLLVAIGVAVLAVMVPPAVAALSSVLLFAAVAWCWPTDELRMLLGRGGGERA